MKTFSLLAIAAIAFTALAQTVPSVTNKLAQTGGDISTGNQVISMRGGQCTVSTTGDLVCNGTITIGNGSSATGAVALTGATSGNTVTATVSATTASGTVTLPGATGTLNYIATPGTSGNWAQFASDGIGLIDGGSPGGAGPGVSAYNSSTQSLTGSGGDTLLTFNAELWDTGSMHSTSVNPERLIAPTTGMYLAACGTQTATASGFMFITIRKNGGVPAGTAGQSVQGNGSNGVLMSLSQKVQLNAGECVVCDVFNGSSTINTVANMAWGQLTKESTAY